MCGYGSRASVGGTVIQRGSTEEQANLEPKLCACSVTLRSHVHYSVSTGLFKFRLNQVIPHNLK